jgi:hypothetical protein
VQLGVVASAFMWVYAGFGAIAGWLVTASAKTLIIAGSHFLSAVLLCRRFRRILASVLFRALEGFGEAFFFRLRCRCLVIITQRYTLESDVVS